MALFLVHHEHSNASCPAGDKEMGPMLLNHLSKANAAKFGVSIHGEAVIDGAHTLYLIIEANDQKNVDQFMTPFAQLGSVDIRSASHCETVVARGSC